METCLVPAVFRMPVSVSFGRATRAGPIGLSLDKLPYNYCIALAFGGGGGGKMEICTINRCYSSLATNVLLLSFQFVTFYNFVLLTEYIGRSGIVFTIVVIIFPCKYKGLPHQFTVFS